MMVLPSDPTDHGVGVCSLLEFKRETSVMLSPLIYSTPTTDGGSLIAQFWSPNGNYPARNFPHY
jgi:hypothetical protein